MESQQQQAFYQKVALAKRELADSVSGESAPSSPEPASAQSSRASVASLPTPASPAGPVRVADSFAFAFDTDGVLVRGGRAIPEAIEAMRVLNGDNEYGLHVPHILTNGGGKTEEERCADLSRQLLQDINPGKFICGHTPMREMASRYRTVLVVGGESEKCREVAEGYGFGDVVTSGDIKHDAATTPFRRLTAEEHANSRERDFSDVVIDAVFVFADSRDWAGDIQIMLDLAMSRGGRLGTRAPGADEGPPFFSHNDVVWSAAHEHVRLGMGTLRRMFKVTFRDLKGGRGRLRTHAFGKPQVPTFEFASRLMAQWRRGEHGLAGGPPQTVYFVGDTPESDVRGTNAINETADNEWYSILVKTGVYQDGTEPAYKPRATVATVLDAVRFGIRREMDKKAAADGTVCSTAAARAAADAEEPAAAR